MTYLYERANLRDQYKINIFGIDLTPGPEAPKYIQIHFYKNTAFGQSFFPKTLNDSNKLDNETKEYSTTIEFKNIF